MNSYKVIYKTTLIAGMLLQCLKGTTQQVNSDTTWWPSVWGSNDERGASNRLGPQNVLAAAQLIKTGKVYQLGREYEPEMPLPGDRPYSLQMLPTYGPFGTNQVIYNVEKICSAICQIGTQFDGLGHIGMRINGMDRYYNGFEGSKILSPTGLSKLGVQNAGIFFTRGVLLDVAGYKGADRLAPGYVITVSDIEGTLKNENIEIREGDVVLIYTGHGNLWKTDKKAFLGDQPGIGIAVAKLLTDKKVVMVGADNEAVEALPGEDKNKVIECHQWLVARNGIYLFENLDLKELANDKVYEFAFMYAPIKFKGATGSPGNPIAVK
jgi:kynurenine formamidase